MKKYLTNLRFFLLILVGIFIILSSRLPTTSAQQRNMVEIPTVANRADYEILLNNPVFFDSDLLGELILNSTRRPVKVIGEYRQIDSRMLKTIPPQYDGRVALFVEDIGMVLLYPGWHDEASRPLEEIARYQRQQVVVTGSLWNSQPQPPGQGSISLIDAPCLLSVDSIELLGTASVDDSEEEIPTVSNRENYEALLNDPNFFHPRLLYAILFTSDRRPVKVIGEYRQFETRQSQNLSSEPNIRVAIFVEGLGSVLLYPEWNEESIRPPEEISSYEGKQVIVTGTLWNSQPKSTLRLVGAPIEEEPTLLYVDSIELLESPVLDDE